jgi:hypothetical protein
MNHRSLLCASALALCASSASAVLIDFESISDNGSSGMLSSYGISSITQTGGTLPFQARSFAAEPNILCPSGSHVFLPGGHWYPGYGIVTTTMTFATPITGLSFKKAGDTSGTYGMAGWKAEAYSPSSALVASTGIGFASGLDFPSPSIQSFALSGTDSIQTIVFSVNYNYMSSSGSVLLDDFSYTLVPEPASLAIIGAGMMLPRRRR